MSFLPYPPPPEPGWYDDDATVMSQPASEPSLGADDSAAVTQSQSAALETSTPQEAPVVQNEAAQNEEILETAAEEVADDSAAKIEELQKDLDASKEAHIRTLAEYDNYRKRTVKEKEASYGDAKASTITELLPVLDNFDRALSVDS